MRGLIPVALLALAYITTYLLNIGGIFFYVIPTLVYVVLFFISYKFVGGLKYSKDIVILALVISTLHISIYTSMGLMWGFGLSPYSRSLGGVVTNVLYIIFQVLALEFTRAYIIKSMKYRSEFLSILIPSIVFTLTYIPPLKFTTLALDFETLRWASTILLPLLARSALASYMVYLGGPLTSVIYVGSMDLYKWVMPILPNIEWFMQGVLGAVIPLVGYIILTSYHLKQRAPTKIRGYSRDVKSLIKSSIIVFLIFLSIMIPTGLLGFKPAVVVSGSMQPLIEVGDVVFIVQARADDIRVGDVIGYVSARGLIVHRVVGYEYINNKKFLVTKGDANNAPDAVPVHPMQVVGKYAGKIPKVGMVVIFIRNFLIPHQLFLTPKPSNNS